MTRPQNGNDDFGHHLLVNPQTQITSCSFSGAPYAQCFMGENLRKLSRNKKRSQTGGLANEKFSKLPKIQKILLD